MNPLTYLVGLIITILLSSVCLIAIIIYFNPFSSGLVAFILFYLSLFISLTGIFTLLGLFIRRISRKRRTPLPCNKVIRQMEISFRQGLFLSIIFISALILQSQRVLAWWYLLILVVIVGLVEWRLMRS
ncbi:MAG: hypothetical protein ABIC36_00295 [bacterium]